MTRYVMVLPDVGEGVAEAELVSWLVEVGDEVTPESPVAELLTDKSNVEISAPVSGTVLERHGEPGDVLAVGSDLVAFETAEGASRAAAEPDAEATGRTADADGGDVDAMDGDTVDVDAVDGDAVDGDAVDVDAMDGDAVDGDGGRVVSHGDVDGDGDGQGVDGGGDGERDDGGDGERDDGQRGGGDGERGDRQGVDGGGDAGLDGARADDGLGEGEDGDGDRSATDQAIAGRPDRDVTLAAPAVRARADALGIDLATVEGSGPDGRVVHGDLDDVLVSGSAERPDGTRAGSTGPAAAGRGGEHPDGTHVEPVRGVRRRIATRLTDAWTQIPHITYVESIDATELERLRAELNGRSADADADADADDGGGDGPTRLTLLPFLARAIVVAARDQPRLNAHHDGSAEELTVFDAVHVGIATQTDDGLLVPVVHHAEARDLDELAAEISRVTDAARAGTASRDELSGSTITITSLGALGGVATTPILNAPEVAIVGVNKLETRPVWRDGRFEPRRMLNLSSSFDHRIVDGWDAAVFVQRIKTLIETPALLFLDP